MRSSLRATVDSEARSAGKLRTGSPAGVSLVRALRSAGGRAQGGLDDSVVRMAAAVLVFEEVGRPGLAQVPFHVIGQHAEKDVRTHAPGQAMMDGPDAQVDGLEGAEYLFGMGQRLVTADDPLRGELGLRDAGFDLDAVCVGAPPSSGGREP